MTTVPPTDAWHDPAVFAVNRLPGRSPVEGRATVAGSPDDERFRLDLSGEWRFDWHPGIGTMNPLHLGAAGATSDAVIEVPGVWQLQGYGTPYYLADTYPPAIGKRASRIPDIDADSNEVGVYTRDFALPPDWEDRRTVVRFEGVKAGLYLFCNGEPVGYSQGSFSPAEFDLTDHVIPGQNTLTAVVLRYTDGTYLEDQDMWFLSGIFRPVLLVSEPIVGIADLWVRPLLAAPYVDGALDCEVTVTGTASPREPMTLALHLRDPGSEEWRQVAEIPVGAGETRVAARVEVPNALTWSAETPHLYEVAAELRVAGECVHVKSTRTGIRCVEIVAEQLHVNGRRVIFKGVNRHDWDPDHGWAVPLHRYRHDLAKAKQLNINAIRTSHYPNPQAFYDAADELGLYVMDECDLETHGVRRKNIPGDNPMWTAAVVDRMERMVLADRNHPSVVMWSLGNEAGLGGEGGGNFVTMRRAALALDDSRPFHYEGDHNPAISDVVSRMYATAEQMATLGRREPLKAPLQTLVTNRFLTDDKDLTPELLAGRPVLLCEYAHAMENSLGNLAEYVDVFYGYENMAGGFIWDYIDQAVHRVTESGQDQWLYGGDFGDRPTHRYFCANGILAADRSEHPSAREVFWAYRDVVVEPVEPARGRYRLANRHVFTDAAAFAPRVEILVDGVVVREQGLGPVSCAPGTSVDWEVPEAVPDEGDGEVYARFTFRSTEATAARAAGTIVAVDEFQVRARRPEPPILLRRDAVRAEETPDGAVVRVGDTAFSVDLADGAVTSWLVGDREVLHAPIRRNYWRALTDNDRGFGNFDPRLQRVAIDYSWRAPKVKVARFQIVPGDDVVRLAFLLRSRQFDSGVLWYDFLPDGSFVAHHSLTPGKDMVRLGFTAQLPSATGARWYGKGPHETYIDRLCGAVTGIHDLPLAELRHDYMRPQENGNRSQVRWVEIHGEWGMLRASDVTGDQLGFTVWPYPQEALDAAEHIHELAHTDEVTVNLDRKQRGVGGDIPGVAALLPPYKMQKGVPVDATMRLEFTPPDAAD